MTDRDLEELDIEDDADFDPDAADEDWDDSLDDVDDEMSLDEDTSDESESDEDGGGDGEEALDELEAEELDMLTDDEESETLIVDEAEELRAIRRAEISLQSGGASTERAEDEFVCQSCFLVLKSSQLANKRKMYCRDCAA